jgi:flagellar assembly factor FliW
MTSSTLTMPAPATDRAAAGAIGFPTGIPGFAAFRDYVVIDRDDLATLQAVDPAGPSFLVVDPRLLDASYDCAPADADLARLGAAPGDPLVWFALVTIGADAASANLQAPIVINARSMTGCQIIRDDDRYPVHFPIGER